MPLSFSCFANPTPNLMGWGGGGKYWQKRFAKKGGGGSAASPTLKRTVPVGYKVMDSVANSLLAASFA
jgi:hypothetical protein